MDREELFEEIRELLRDIQEGTVEDAWEYSDEILIPQVRSALRHIRVRGVVTDAEMDREGDFTTEPTEDVGLLIALRVASRLLTGDLTTRLMDGELGTYFRAGPDIIDTRNVVQFFERSAKGLQEEYQELLTMLLSDVTDSAGTMFSEPDLDAV